MGFLRDLIGAASNSDWPKRAETNKAKHSLSKGGKPGDRAYIYRRRDKKAGR